MDIETPSQPVADITSCKCCSTAISENDQFCQSCGFPLKGTEEEQNNFIYSRNYKHIELEGLDKKIRSAGTTLYVLAGLFLVFGLVYFGMNASDSTASAMLITYGILAVLFLLLGFWSKKKPVAAIISGLVLYILLQILSAIDDPVNIVKGIIVKIIIIGYLIKGMQSAFEAEKIRKQLNIS
jgi:hypothetical protein